jgi:hypothetical protein
VVPDDATVEDHDVVYRWSLGDGNQLSEDPANQRWRLTSAGLIVQHDGISVYLGSVLSIQELTVDDILLDTNGDVVWELTVGELRELRLGIERDPIDEGRRVDPAHALITFDPGAGRSATKKASRRLAKRMRYVAGDLPRWPPTPPTG